MLINSKSSKPRLGQHFLFDERVLNKIVDAGRVSRRDVVLEIGAGTGNLTQKLLMRARKVIAVELDQRLVGKLKARFQDFHNLEIIQKDILQVASRKFQVPGYKVLGNIPYYISAKILRKFTQNKNRPKLLVLLVQKEVAQRVCAKPGKMSILAVAVQTYGQPEIVDYVSREKFSPAPEVDSAILKIELYKRSQLAREMGWFGRRGRPMLTALKMDQQEEAYFRLVKAGFSARRKQIHNNLRNGFHLSQAEVDLWLKRAEIKRRARPQELGVEDWVRLFDSSTLY